MIEKSTGNIFKKLSVFSIGAITYIFFAKILGTFNKLHLYDSFFIETKEIFYVISFSILTLFFLKYSRDFGANLSSFFKMISSLPIAGYFFLLISHLINFLNIIAKGLWINPKFLNTIINTILPFLNYLFLSIFFAILYSYLRKEKNSLKDAVLWLFFSLILVDINFVLVFLNLFFIKDLAINSNFISFMILSLFFQYITYLNFFYRFSKSLK